MLDFRHLSLGHINIYTKAYMPELIRDTRARSVAKAASWRGVASAETLAAAGIFTGKVTAALEIMGAEFFVNTATYYIFDRVWPAVARHINISSQRMEALAKTVAWRCVGACESLGISYLTTGSWKTAASIASVSTVGKFIGYYYHERLWAEWSPLANFGRKTKISPSDMRMFEMLEAAARESVEWVVPEDRRPKVAAALSDGITKGFVALLPRPSISPKINVNEVRSVWKTAVKELAHAAHVSANEATEISMIGGDIIKELSRLNR
jgi:uncharacterized membrane protein